MKSSKNIVTLAGYILLSSFVAALPSGYIPVYGQSDADRKGKPAATETPGTSNDVVLSAFADELSRSMSRLQLKDHVPPYFISYLAKSTESFVVSSRFGALDSLLDEHRRTLATDVRVGSYKFDSSR